MRRKQLYHDSLPKLVFAEWVEDMKNVRIFNEDCLKGMKRIKSNVIDLILTDLPYGTTDASFDKKISLPDMWQQFNRIIKDNAAIVLFCQMNCSKNKSSLPFALELISTSPIKFRYEWIWIKTRGVGFMNAKKMPLRHHENILVFYKKLPTYNPQFFYSKPYKSNHYAKNNTLNYDKFNDWTSISEDGRRYPKDFIVCQQPKGFHPQQKPVEILEYLIKTYTNEGEIVLDATMGSGSTGIAAINTKRKFIGFELDTNYFLRAAERLKANYFALETVVASEVGSL